METSKLMLSPDEAGSTEPINTEHSQVSKENIERERNTISDQALDYFSEHSITGEALLQPGEDFYKSEFWKEIKRLLFTKKEEAQNKGITFKKDLPPLINQSQPDIGVVTQLSSIEYNQRYFQGKGDWSKLSPKERGELLEANPYGHGAAINKVFQREYGLLNVDSPFVEYGFFAYKNLFAELLAYIDKGKIVFPQLEEDFKAFYNAYIDAMGRLVTLVVKDPHWNFTELTDHLTKKLGEGQFDLVNNLFSHAGRLPEFKEIFAPERAEDFSQEDLSQATKISTLMVETYRTIDDYLKAKVVYASEVRDENVAE